MLAVDFLFDEIVRGYGAVLHQAGVKVVVARVEQDREHDVAHVGDVPSINKKIFFKSASTDRGFDDVRSDREQPAFAVDRPDAAPCIDVVATIAADKNSATSASDAALAVPTAVPSSSGNNKVPTARRTATNTTNPIFVGPRTTTTISGPATTATAAASSRLGSSVEPILI